ncbi:glycosyl hydrolase family 61-domain-containing protein [Microdochium trichocladiopsis]|uniref:lytic cellulose monooxygenase (C4-dehydrogenating) n=1 Tax=Microdochium trichocladiopsis TaxID=1682393 RepID=A0A9P8XS51_9PEZI|nr:glycosyl hydrolase family 61-domain-containing protein [Microdochium trichocladiopsis]KAH7014408.1 glycosyl hydrolase family 61-domain-containing protein [Microdochium trichocladiopsis]
MRSTYIRALGCALGATQVAAHATFQNLWVNGVDYITQCARLPSSNSPVTNVASNDIRCNAPNVAVSKKCPVPAGSTVTVEMHQQNGDRSCSNEAIGGAHYGPVQVYLSSVSDATKADGSSSWFKIFADTWAKNSAGGSGDDDFWGTKDLNKCCGLMNVKIPSDIAPGDYLLRAEALALHTAGSSGGAQFYMTCFQITVSGSGSAKPAGVSLPGAYKASDPGILVNIHAPMAGYTAPGPAVYSGGSVKVAGSGCAACESTCKPGSGPTGTIGGGGTTSPTSTTGGGGNGGGASSTTTGGGGSAPTGCTVAAYGQCGGQSYTGCTTCASGSCKKQNDFYSQCIP